MQENCRASAWGPAKKHALCCDCSDLFLNNPAVGTFKCHRAQDAGAIGTGIQADATGEFDNFFKDRMDVHNGHARDDGRAASRSEEHTSELQSLMRTSYAVCCLKKKTNYHI